MTPGGNPNFEFATATRIIFGAGSFRQAGRLAREFGQCALVVTGRNPGRAQALLSLLQEERMTVSTFSVSGEPEIETIKAGIAQARQESVELVVGFGGGSAIDTGKAIAAMLTNETPLLEHLEVIGAGKPLTEPSAPFIAIPTTAGTGSEVTRNAVLGSRKHRVKVSLRSPLMLPRVALVDPELTHDLPPAITASTGLDALTQLIEPFVCSRANPVTDALCREAIPRVARSLLEAWRDGTNAAAREDMALASLFGGLALANAGLGAVHGLAGPIGGMFPAPHGAICATLLPHVMAANLHALRERQPQNPALYRYNEVARLLTGNASANSDAGVKWVGKLVGDLKIQPLSAYGITREHNGLLVEMSAKSSSMKANPVLLSPEELREILEKAGQSRCT